MGRMLQIPAVCVSSLFRAQPSDTQLVQSTQFSILLVRKHCFLFRNQINLLPILTRDYYANSFLDNEILLCSVIRGCAALSGDIKSDNW